MMAASGKGGGRLVSPVWVERLVFLGLLIFFLVKVFDACSRWLDGSVGVHSRYIILRDAKNYAPSHE